MRHDVCVCLAVLWCIGGFSGAQSWASDSNSTRATLRGLSGVQVVIEHLDPEVERGAQLTHRQLQTDVERRLRQAGVVVFTKAESLKTPGAPFLIVNVKVLLHASGIAAFRIDVEVYQSAHLEADNASVSISTWSVSSVGAVGVGNLRVIRERVSDYVDKFLIAWLSVHQSPSGNVAPPASPRKQRGVEPQGQ
jgi:hypothetical protein